MKQTFWDKVYNLSDWQFGAFALGVSFVSVFTGLMIHSAVAG